MKLTSFMDLGQPEDSPSVAFVVWLAKILEEEEEEDGKSLPTGLDVPETHF